MNGRLLVRRGKCAVLLSCLGALNLLLLAYLLRSRIPGSGHVRSEASLLALAPPLRNPFVALPAAPRLPPPLAPASTTPGACSYAAVAQTDFPGFDLTSMPCDSLRCCASSCCAEPSCVAFTLTGGSCYLKRLAALDLGGVPRAGIDSGVMTLRLGVEGASCASSVACSSGSCDAGTCRKGRDGGSDEERSLACSYLAYPRSDFPGHDLLSTPCDSVSRCAAICCEEPGCAAFSLAGGSCNLKGKDALGLGSFPRESVESGALAHRLGVVGSACGSGAACASGHCEGGFCHASDDGAGNCAYFEHAQSDFPGHDLASKPCESLGHCAAMCCEVSACAAFSFAGGSCNLKSKAALGLINRHEHVTAGTIVHRLGLLDTPCVTGAGCASQMCAAGVCVLYEPPAAVILPANLDFSSYVLASYAASNLTECRDICGRSLYCAAFAFRRNGACHLHSVSAIDSIVASTGVSSGVLRAYLEQTGGFCLFDYACLSQVCANSRCEAGAMPALSTDSAPPPEGLPSPLPPRQPIYVSLTTSPRRLPRLDITLWSLTTQSLPASQIYVFVPPVFARDGSLYDLSLPVVARMQLRGVKFVQVPRDLGPITKIAPLVSIVPEREFASWLVSVDDDVFYPPNLLEDLTAAGASFFDSSNSTDSGAVSMTGAIFENYAPEANSSEGFKYSEAQYSGHGTVADFLEAFGAIAYRRSSFGDVSSFSSYVAQVASDRNCFSSDDVSLSNWARRNGATLRAIHLPKLHFPGAGLQLLPWGLGSDALHNSEGSSGSNNAKYWRCLQFLQSKNLSSFVARGKRVYTIPGQ